MYNIADKNEVIREIKKYLYAISTNTYPEIGRTTIDGFYDKETADSVRRFQEIKNLGADGIVDYLTFLALYAEYKSIIDKENTKDYIVEDSGLPIVFGDLSEDVRALHILINQLRNVHKEIASVGTGSYYSKRTEAAVRELRKIFGMQDGVGVDAILFNRMIAELDAHKRNMKTDDLKSDTWV